MLFALIQAAKSLACYEIANIGFAVLLDQALEYPKAYQLIWESQENLPEEWQMFEMLDTFYDLAVISDGLQQACIPAPLLKPGVAKAFMSLSSPDYKHQSNRVHSIQKWLEADKAIKKLWDSLITAYPNTLELAEKYLGCFSCMYFAGEGNAINCVPHPFGVCGRTCVDFAVDIEAIANKCKFQLKHEWEAHVWWEQNG